MGVRFTWDLVFGKHRVGHRQALGDPDPHRRGSADDLVIDHIASLDRLDAFRARPRCRPSRPIGTRRLISIDKRVVVIGTADGTCSIARAKTPASRHRAALREPRADRRHCGMGRSPCGTKTASLTARRRWRGHRDAVGSSEVCHRLRMSAHRLRPRSRPESLPTGSARTGRTRSCRRPDRLGFDSLWFPERINSMQLDPIVAMAYVAGAT